MGVQAFGLEQFLGDDFQLVPVDRHDLFRLGMGNLNEVATVTAYKLTPSRWEITYANS